MEFYSRRPAERPRPLPALGGFAWRRKEQKMRLDANQKQGLVKVLGEMHKTEPTLLQKLGENISKKIAVAERQPVEYGLYFLLTAVMPFVDEISAAAVVDSFSKKVLGSSGFKPPHPESSEYKMLLKRTALAALRENPVERNALALSLSQVKTIPQLQGKLTKPLLSTFKPRERVGLNIAALRSSIALQQKLRHQRALLERARAGKRLTRPAIGKLSSKFEA